MRSVNVLLALVPRIARNIKLFLKNGVLSFFTQYDGGGDVFTQSLELLLAGTKSMLGRTVLYRTRYGTVPYDTYSTVRYISHLPGELERTETPNQSSTLPNVATYTEHVW